MFSLPSKNDTTVYYITILPEWAGQRLDNFLINHLKGLPKTRLYRIIRKGEIRVNKGRVKPCYRLEAGDNIRIPPIRDRQEPQPVAVVRPRLASELEKAILYEDDALLILNKPAGLAVHGGSGLSFGAIEALRILRPNCASLELVHRLDRETSGCLMFSKRRSMLRELHRMLREGHIQKVYWALVQGTWKQSQKVTIPLLKNQMRSGERIVRASTEALGQSAVTHFRPLKYYRDSVTKIPMTLVEAKPITGRTHQIRVHACESGFPIMGDVKYGHTTPLKILSRMFLHAQRLSLLLPGTEKWFSIEAPLDAELSNVLSYLGEVDE